MLEKIKYFVEYGQAVVNYTQKIVGVINTAVRGWPVWIPPVPGAQNNTEGTIKEL